MSVGRTIYPTHACFDDALEFLELELNRGVALEELEREYIVVHGICVGDAGESYVHAWVELGPHVWQGGLVDVDGKRERCFFAGVREDFYAEYRVRKSTRYTVLEALAENGRTGHYGPWAEEYRALVADGDHRMAESKRRCRRRRAMAHGPGKYDDLATSSPSDGLRAGSRAVGWCGSLGHHHRRAREASSASASTALS